MHGMDHLPGRTRRVPHQEPCRDRNIGGCISAKGAACDRSADHDPDVCDPDLFLLPQPGIYQRTGPHGAQNADFDGALFRDLRSSAGIHHPHADQLYL